LKRLILTFIVLLAVLGPALAEEAAPPVSVGMQAMIDYRIATGAFSLWNLRYGVGMDLLVHLGANFYLGCELQAVFGLHKADLNETYFDRIDAQFPFHATLTFFFAGFQAQLYGGITYSGRAQLTGGALYTDDFVFRLLPDVGAKIGWGTVNNVFLKFGYTFNDCAFLGLGVRLGLF
jgi:hypothetical protein